MNNSWVDALIAAGATAVAALGAWLVARRRNSGSIETSDAATLWAESNAMRNEAIEERRQAIEELRLCRSAAIELRAELAATRDEMAELRRELRTQGGAG